MKFSTLLFFSAFTFQAISVNAQESSNPAKDHFKVTEQILQKDPPNFSTNIEFGGFAPWFPHQKLNAWNLFYNLEPMAYQAHGQVDGGGADFAQHKNAPGFSFWDCARSGYWDGADMYFYRLENGKLKFFRKAKVAKSVIGNDPETNAKTEEKMYFTESGPEIRSGDFYVLRMTRTEPSMQIRPALIGGAKTPLLDDWCLFAGNVNWKFDATTFAPEGGSTASLKMDIQGATEQAPAGPWHWLVIDTDKAANLRFNPGKTYKVSVWLKEEGMSKPLVRLQMGTIITKEVEVSKEWKKFEFDLPWENPEKPYSTTQNDSSRLFIGATSDGTLWMDNLLIYQTDVAPFAVMPRDIEVLKDFKPQVLRLWAGHDAPSFEYWVREGFAQLNAGGYGRSKQPAHISLRQALDMCIEVGADPWLILNPWYTAEENAGLMEYLAGPADKGYGALRAKQGHPEPYTKSFKKIYIESANEAWNQIMKYQVSGKPLIYAAMADRQFSELKSSPLYSKEKFEFIANGWDSSMERDGWTQQVAAGSREADRIDVAYYFGGWEKPAEGDTSTDEIYQDKLFTPSLEYGRKLVDALLLDSEFSKRFALAITNDPSLLTKGLESIKSEGTRFTEDQLTGQSGDISGLWQKDTNFPESVRGLLAGRRDPIEAPFWYAAYRAMAKDPTLSKQTMETLDIADTNSLLPICEALIDLNAPSRLQPILKKNPEVLQHWIASSILSDAAKNNFSDAQTNPEKLSYNTTNELNTLLRNKILALLSEKNEALLNGIRQETTPEVLNAKLSSTIDYYLRTTSAEAPGQRATQLMIAMKKDPAFALSSLEIMGKKPEVFDAEAKSIALLFATAIAEIYSGAESFKPESETRMLLKNIPPELRNELLDRMDAEFANRASSLSAESQFLLPVMTKAMRGDTAPAKALAENPAFLTLLRKKLTETLPAPFLDAAKKDAKFGDRLLTELARIPSLGGKKLANYEGGPGYALPGAGKPPSEDDENVGKSLALGTATLDLSMQFLAAGSAPIAYYDYKTGEYWASHNNPIERIAYPSWLSLKMRNTLCPGDLVKVESLDVKRIDILDKKVVKTTNDGQGATSTVKGRNGVALSACYAFRDGNNISLLLINRSMSEPRSVIVDLPAGLTGPSKLFSLTHPDPKTNNRLEENIKIQETPGPDLKTGMEITVPPASVIVVTSAK